MADTQSFTTIVDVKTNALNALKDIANLRDEIDYLKNAQKQLDRTTEEGRIQYERYAVQIKALQSDIRNKNAQAQRTIEANKLEADSIFRLQAEYRIATNAYKALSAEQRNTKAGEDLKKLVNELATAVRSENKAIQDSRYEVGKYGDALRDAGIQGQLFREGTVETNRNLGDLQRQLRELRNISFAGKTEEEIRLVQKAIADTNTAITDLRRDIATLDTDNTFANLVESINVVVASVTLLTNSLSLFGVEDENIQKVTKATTQLIATMNALNIITTYVRKNRAQLLVQNLRIVQANISETLAKRLNTLQQQQLNLAENASIITKTALAVQIKLVTAAQWLWNAAINANPILFLVTGAALLAATIYTVTKALNKQTEEEKEAIIVNREYETQVRNTEQALIQLDKQREVNYNNEVLRQRRQLLDLEKSGATEEQLNNKRLENENILREIQVKYHDERLKNYYTQYEAILVTIEAQRVLVNSLDKSSERYKIENENLIVLLETRNKLVDSINDEYFARENLLFDIEEANNKFAKSQTKSNAKQVNSERDKFNKILESQRRFNEQRIKAEAGFQSDDFFIRQEYQDRIFELSQETERKILENDRKYKEITEEEYKDRLNLLELAQIEYQNRTIKETNVYYANLRKNIIKNVSKTIDEEIEITRKKYQELRKEVEGIREPLRLEGESDESYQRQLNEYRDFLFNRNQILIRFEEQERKEIERIRIENERKITNEIENEIRKRYEKQLMLASGNEEETNKILLKSLQEQSKLKREAGLSDISENIKIREIQIKDNELLYERELLQAGDNSQKRYNITKQYLLRERDLYKDNSLEILRIERELLENEKQLWDERTSLLNNWAGTINDLWNAINESYSNGVERQTAKAEQEYNNDLNNLDKKLAKGLITETKYNLEVAKLEQDLDEKRKKIEKDAAKRERSLKAFSIITDTAAGITKAVAQSPLTFGLPFSAFVAATGALQLANVYNAPLAERGMYIGGKSHANGGTLIEAERGEVIINKKSVSMFAPLLSQINEAGGGVPFVKKYQDGGYIQRSALKQSNINGYDFESNIINVIRNQKIYATIEDIRRENERYINIENRGNV